VSLRGPGWDIRKSRYTETSLRALLPVAAAIALGFLEFSEKVFASLQRVPPENRWKEVVRWYSPQHCDHPDSSCPVVTLAPEIARTKLPVRKRMAGLMYPKLDVLMNNAGIMLHKNLKVPAADLDGLMAEMNINVGA
jgi:NAD(P)-dependent dehydrogenase (short-subunit alcohol dehydrogenase family)